MGNRKNEKLETLAEISKHAATGIGNAPHYHNYRNAEIHLWSDNAAFLADVEGIFDKIWDDSRREKDKFKKHLLIVLLNLYLAHLEADTKWVAYSRDRNSFSTRSRYTPVWLSHAYLTGVVDSLSEQGFIEHATGFQDHRTGYRTGKLSRMRATNKLWPMFRSWHENMVGISPNAPSIIKRDKDKNPIEYEDTRDSTRMRKRLDKINAMLVKADIRLDMSDAQKWDYDRQRERQGKSRVWYWRKSLQRVFNDGSFRKGGRFYGGWWMEVEKDMRSRIFIDGKATVEKDYSALHPSILYARSTGSLPGYDPYEVYGKATPPLIRKVCKKLVLMMLNADSVQKAKKAFAQELRKGAFPPGDVDEIKPLDLDGLIGRIRELNRPIAEHFNTGAWGKLQYIDSQIAERVMVNLAGKGIVSLPVHDSFIVQAQHEDELVEAMREAFMWKCGGVEPVID